MTKSATIACVVLASMMTACAGVRTHADLETIANMPVDCRNKQEQIAFLHEQKYTKDEKMMLVLTTPQSMELVYHMTGDGKRTTYRRVIKTNEYDAVIALKLRELAGCK